MPFFLSPADEVISNVTANEESDAEIAAPEQMLRVSAANTLASLNANSLFNRYSLDRTENDVRIVGEQMAQGSWMVCC